MTIGVYQLALMSSTWPFFLDVGTGGSQTGDIKVGAKSEHIQIHRHRIGKENKKKKQKNNPSLHIQFLYGIPSRSTSHLFPLVGLRNTQGTSAYHKTGKNTMLRIHEFHLQRITHVKASLIRDNADCLLSR